MNNYQKCRLEAVILQTSQLLLPTFFLSPFMWEYLKDKVYRTRASNDTQLKREIISAIHENQTEMLQNVWKKFIERLTEVLRQNGAHFDHL